MARLKERSSNLHRQAGAYANTLLEELKKNWHGSYTLDENRLREYLRSAYLRGYEDRILEGKQVVPCFNPSQSTKTFPDGAPQRESYLTEKNYRVAEKKYDQEWRQAYICENCGDASCPNCGISPRG